MELPSIVPFTIITIELDIIWCISVCLGISMMRKKNKSILIEIHSTQRRWYTPLKEL